MDRPKCSLHPLSLKCLFDNPQFPVGDKVIAGMLQLAAPAGFVMAARRRDTVLRRGFDSDIRQLRALLHTAHLFIRQGTGGKKRAMGDSVALVAKAEDGCCGSGYICHSR